MKFNKTHVFKMVLTSVMIALNIVLERFLGFQTGRNHITLSVITIVFPLVFLGLQYAVAVAALGDILGAVISPIGPYFPGYTLTNVIVAVCLGLFLRKKVTILRVVIATVLNKIIGTLLLNSLWVAMTVTGLKITNLGAYLTYMIGRIPQAAIMTGVEIVLIIVVFHEKSHIRKLLSKVMHKVL